MIEDETLNEDGESDMTSEDPDEGREPYVKRDRAIGYGPLRIGTKFSFTEDIYSLLFIAFVHKEYKEEREQFKKTKNKLIAEKLGVENSSESDDDDNAEEEEEEEEAEEEQDENKSQEKSSLKTEEEG